MSPQTPVTHNALLPDDASLYGMGRNRHLFSVIYRAGTLTWSHGVSAGT